MPCPDIEELEHYVSETSPADWLGAVRGHLYACEDCQGRLLELREHRRIEPSVRRVFARSDSARPAMVVADRLAQYQVVRELGRGGSGVVYEAEQESPRRRVALKVLSGPVASEPRHDRLLQRECRALARLRHSSIAAIYDAGRTPDGRSFFAMELVEGLPLAIYAQRHGLPLEDRLMLFAAVCETVAYAHQRGVLHRDLKPSKILVEADGTPKLLDFGLARVMELGGEDAPPASSMLTEPGRVFGTLPYMSPEHVRGAPHEIDVRSDVYSLGVVLFEMLTGRMPYELQPGNLLQAALIISEQAPALPRAIGAYLPAEVETIMLKALEKDPDRRYQSDSELAADLRRFLRHEPVIARPPTSWYQLRKFARRNRALMITVAIAAALLLGVTAAAMDRAYEATRERDAAERRLELARHSVNYLFRGVGGQMVGVLGTADIQRHLAEEAFVFYKRIADEGPDDLAEQTGYWNALRRLAEISLEVGQIERAELLAGQLRGSVEAAAARHAGNLMLMREQAHAQCILSQVAKEAGRTEEARHLAVGAMQLCRQVVAGYGASSDLDHPGAWTIPDVGPKAGSRPDYVAAQEDLARVLTYRAEQFLSAGEADAADRDSHEALQIIDFLERTDPTMEPIYRRDLSGYAPLAGPILLNTPARPRYQRYRSSILTGLGEIAATRGDPWQAASEYRAALDIAEELFAESPLDPAFIENLAAAHERMAHYAHSAGDQSAANFHARSAEGELARLSGADPSHVSLQRRLAAIRELGNLSTDEHR